MLNLTLALIVLALIVWRIIDPPHRAYRNEYDEVADALHNAYVDARLESLCIRLTEITPTGTCCAIHGPSCPTRRKAER